MLEGAAILLIEDTGGVKILRGVSRGRLDIRFAEVLSFEQQRFAACLGECICEAVTKIQ